MTGPLEDALRNVRDIKFVSSTSRENSSVILIRFRELSEREFDKRIADLRREVQSKANDELPDDAEDPNILEITSSNGFPTATVVVTGQANDERLRRQGKLIKEELERLTGVDQVNAFGFDEPELHVEVDPRALAAHGLSAINVAEQLRAAYRDVSAGKINVGNDAWLLRVSGKTADPETLAQFLLSPPASPQLKVRLDSVAEVKRGRKESIQLVSFNGKPAISMAVSKVSFTNTLELVDRINAYIGEKNNLLDGSGISLVLSDDQTVQTRKAINVMQTNAFLGLALVLVVCWLFLGLRIAAFVTMGIAFSIAGTFWILNMAGHTVNVSVLLGVVIVLGMLVDDAVVVVESLYYRLQRGQEAVSAALDALREVVRPVTSAVFTTISAFLPLMLLPGILGDFMLVVPLVVTIGLLVSLIEAYWILPSHVIGISKNAPLKSDPLKHWRGRWTHNVRVRYTKALAYVFRRPAPFFAAGVLAFVLSGAAFATGAIKVNFFTMDPIRMFYVNVDMPPRAPLEETLAQTVRIEDRMRPLIPDYEVRAITSMAGIKFTDSEVLYGDNYGQIQVSMNPKERDSRSVSEVVDSIRETVLQTPGESTISFFELSGGPPVASDIEARVRGDNEVMLRAATDALKSIIRGIEGSENIVDDDVPGRYELSLELDYRAIREAGLNPGDVARLLRLHLDGEIIAFTRDRGEKLELRVKGPERRLSDIDAVLDDAILLPGGGTTSFAALTTQSVTQNSGSIKNYNYRRSIKVQGDLTETSPNTIAAVGYIRDEWAKISKDYPNIELDFSGQFEDIEESLDAMGILFLFGMGLIYLILATQFRSYFQPMLIIVSVPMAFTGVSFGLFVTQQPLSLFTLYGIVALTGIAVNAAIVLIDATNSRIASGMRPLHAVIYAARRRVIPILMTTLTTIAGLFSLATGLGGKSLLWGPVAASMVFGLFVATTMTLFLVPVLFRLFMRMRDHRVQNFFRRLVGRPQQEVPSISDRN